MLRLSGTRCWHVRIWIGIQRLDHIQPKRQMPAVAPRNLRIARNSYFLFLGGKRHIRPFSTITDEAPQHRVSASNRCSGTRLTSRLP